MSTKRFLTMALLLALVPAWGRAQSEGALDGVITGNEGVPLSGVTVVINEAAMAEITDASGHYHLGGVPAGKYTVTFSLGERVSTAEGVEVRGGETSELNHAVDWDVSFAETITVFSASRRRERVVEAPAAVTVISEQQLEREAPTGQLAKSLEFTPGAQVTQSGLYDFNLNTRGFNSSLNRRVPALVDGRDPTVPFLMSNDWPSMSSMGDVASLELVRGPSSALYGTNAYNGILVLTTKQPRYSQGGQVQLTGGELSTLRGDARWSGALTETAFLKAHGSYTQSDDFYRSRNGNPALGQRPEYSTYCASNTATNCLRREAVPLVQEDDTLWLAGLRFDKYFGENFFTLEGGTSYAEGPVLQTGIGRVQVTEQDRPWIRGNFSHPHFNVLAYQNKRDAPGQKALASGADLVLDEENWAVELQTNWDFAANKGRIIGGISYKEEEIDTRNDAGVATLSDPPVVGADRQAAYAQVEYAFTPKFKAVVAARWDAADDLNGGDLHDDEISPKVAFVIAPNPNHTFRLSYNEAFQSPNYSEFFLSAPAGAPANLAGAAFINPSPQVQALAPFLAQLGFGCYPGAPACVTTTGMPILAKGNNSLETESITSYEVGYSGIFGGKAFITVDYYKSELENFVTDLLPGVNPAYPRYQVPGAFPPPVALGVQGFLNAALGPNAVGVTTVNGRPALVLSYTNAGSADTQGVDLGINFYMTSRWNMALNYSWFDFEIKDKQLGDQLLPNAPENSASGSVSYTGDRFDATVAYRWVEDFDWAAGVFVGPVPSYDTLDINANFDVTEHFRLGLNVSNALDEEHYQSFGGDLIGRRALGSVTFAW